MQAFRKYIGNSIKLGSDDADSRYSVKYQGVFRSGKIWEYELFVKNPGGNNDFNQHSSFLLTRRSRRIGLQNSCLHNTLVDVTILQQTVTDMG